MKLLLVDDDLIERITLRELLHAYGVDEIVEAEDGEKAFELLRGGLEPDMCFFDVRMPKIDGPQLLAKIRQEQNLRHLKVAITTSSRDREVVMAVGKLGITGYLLKPYTAQKTNVSLKQIFRDTDLVKSTLATRNLLGKTIQIVDDDTLTRTALRAMIDAGPNWEIVEAEDGIVALDQLRNGLRPDLMIMDLRMPRLDGSSLLSRVRESAALRHIPVLVVSGQQDRERIRSVAQMRVSGYLLKPFTAEKVRSTVNLALRTSSTLPALVEPTS